MKHTRALVDVDNTLFDFATPLYKIFLKSGINIPSPQNWNTWDYFYPEFMTSKVAHEHFDMVHLHQLEYKPFNDARAFLENLIKDRAVVIVSHRRSHQCNELRKWFDVNDLPYDVVECSNDKTKMFNKNVFDVVIDDCPRTLEAAYNAGIKCYGLQRPWNADCKYGKLLPTLTEIGKVGGWVK
jgi:HAD superfamily hydrolase (TIGR01509 family)